jgi:phage terminase large subunit GpA-like protein
MRAVPPGVRFLVASVDVQRKWFEVQVHGIGIGGDVWIIDRFPIRKSRRYDEDGERFFVSPGAYPEDWKQLVQEVMLMTYPLLDGSGRHMQVKMTVCDSGGEAGVTTNAYNFWRWLKRGPETEEKEDYGWVGGLAGRFILIKGDSNKNAPRVKVHYPDAQRKDRHSGARGDVPVLFINTNGIKDTVNHKLDRTAANGGRVNFPKWLPDSFYTELTVEVKTLKGWENLRGYRNESWDLLCYCEAVCMSPLIAIEHIKWEDPPGWADEFDLNDLVFNPVVEPNRFAPQKKQSYDLAKLANTLA